MLRQLVLARSNFRRETGQTAIFLVLILIGSMVLNLWLMLITDYHANFDRWHEKLHAEDVLLLVSADTESIDREFWQLLDERSDVAEYTVQQGLSVVSAIPYNGGTVSNPTMVLPIDGAQERTIGQVEITAEAAEADGLYYPLLYETDELPLGQLAEIEINGRKREVQTAGFLNSVMAGSHNCGLLLFLAGDKTYAELQEEASPGILVSIRLTDRSQSEEVRGELTEALQRYSPDIAVQASDYVRNRLSRYVTQMIMAAILGAAVCFELIVAMTVAASNVATHVQQSMSELGVLKAIGYTGSDLIGALILQYALLSLPAALAGAALGYAAFPTLSDIMSAQTGMPYEVHFLPGPFAASVLICTGVIVAVVWLAAKRIQKVEPITALRSGVETHSFRRNPMPLAGSRLPVNAALALKNCASSPRRNVTICVTMAALTLLIVFAVVLSENVLVDSDPILDLMGVEQSDVMLDVIPSADEALSEYLEKDSRVESFHLYLQDTSLAEPGGPGLWPIVIEDGDDLNNPKVLYDGRMPVYENEVALGSKHAAARGLGIGDMIDFGPEDDTVSYLITGITQGSNYLGDEAFLTREGYERMGPLTHVTYYVDLTKPADAAVSPMEAADDFIREAEEEFGPSLQSSANLIKTLDAVLSVYVTAFQLIVYVLAALTMILTVLVMVLLTRTAVNARMRDYGILKAIGYTTKNLVGQTVLSFLPALAGTEAVGLVVWSLTINSIVGLFLHNLGIMRCDFEIPGGAIAWVGVLLLIFSLMVVALMAVRIRKADPVELMADD